MSCIVLTKFKVSQKWFSWKKERVFEILKLISQSISSQMFGLDLNMPLKNLAVNKNSSMKKVFLKISQNSLENTRVKVSFLTKLQEHFFLQNASVSIEKKYMRCDHLTFMNRELSKSIVLRTKMRTVFLESRLKKTKQIAESK